jgi:hypothetical protein
MRKLAWIAAAAVVGLATPAAKADVWSGFLGFDAPYQASGNGAYTVAGMGDADLGVPYRYWGGTHWVDCRGTRPPYDSYDRGRQTCRQEHVRRSHVLRVRD